jgi:uncharacterized coiled-coil DUF342 family protein
MKSAIGDQLEELEKKRKTKLEQIKKLSESIRNKSDEILEARKKIELNSYDHTKVLQKRIELIEFKISTENLPLSVEKELANQIAFLETEMKKAGQLEKGKGIGGGSIDALEKDIKELKVERDKLKESLDSDGKDTEELRKMIGEKRNGNSDEVLLGEIATMKRESKG